jgi:arsenate reductase
MSAGGTKKSVLILCTGNSCRSQMAEAFWRKYGGDDWDVASAGTRPKGEVYPPAVLAMSEKGIDIRAFRPKGPDAFLHRRFDLVITVCDNAEKECPTFTHVGQHLHWPFDDPPKAAGGDAEKMAVCRRVRDEIESKIRSYLATANARPSTQPARP